MKISDIIIKLDDFKEEMGDCDLINFDIYLKCSRPSLTGEYSKKHLITGDYHMKLKDI